MAEKKFKGISVITAGPALGHDMVIDETTLEQVVELGNASAPVKVLANHSNDVGAILGMLQNFRIDGPRVRADLELLQNHPQAEYYAELLGKLPDQLGFSISFSGIPRTAEDGTALADVRDLWSVDLVTRAAANKSIYSAKTVDKAREPMIENKELKSEATVEAAPVAPAAPAAEPVKLAEPTLSDINAKLDAIMAMLTADAVSDVVEEPMAANVEEKKLEAAVVEGPKVEAAPEPVAVEAKAEEIKAEAPVVNEGAALKAELAAKVVELEASRGIKPLEVETNKTFSRAELLAQFNAEKNPRRAAEIFKQIKFAR